MRFFTCFLALLLAFSCSANSKKVNVSNQDIKLISSILKPLAQRGITVKSISQVKPSAVTGLKQYQVSLLDKHERQELNRYIFISENGKYVVFNVLEVKNLKGNVSLSPLRPSEGVKSIKVNLSWLKSMDDELNKNHIPHLLGNGKHRIYVAWDIYCPFCYDHFKDVVGKELKKLDVTLDLIPLPIHGKASIEGFTYFTQLARKMGMKGAMSYIFSMGNGNFQKYAECFSKKVNQNYPKMDKGEKKNLGKFYTNIRKQLLSHYVHATPTIMYIPNGSKGYVFVGFRPLKEVLSMK